MDGIDIEAPDSVEWTPDTDRENSQTTMHLFALGLHHKLNVKSKAFINSSLSLSGNGLSFEEQYVNDFLQENPTSDAQRSNYKLTLQSSVTTNLSDRHFNKTGFYVNGLMYDLDIDHSPDYELAMESIADERGQSMLYQFYSQSQYALTPKLTMNAGIHSQYFQLNKDFTIEPRMSLDYQLTGRSNVALAYGLHSQTESLPFYFIKDDTGNEPNKDLEFMKSHHWVVSYNHRLSDNINLSIEPYYQYLTDVPVAPDSYISTINTQDNLFFDEILVNEGTGRNMGVDLTLERYQQSGFYALFTASIFDSKYTAADGIERNTRLNKSFVGNAVVGKEWQVGKSDNNIFSANLRLNYLGGNREEAINVESSLAEERLIFEEVDGQISFSEKFKDTPIYSFTLSYRKNKPNFSSVWSLQVLNAGLAEEFDVHSINRENGTIERDYVGIMIPNLSYKIEF